jgi:hypothetical protein
MEETMIDPVETLIQAKDANPAAFPIWSSNSAGPIGWRTWLSRECAGAGHQPRPGQGLRYRDRPSQVDAAGKLERKLSRGLGGVQRGRIEVPPLNGVDPTALSPAAN